MRTIVSISLGILIFVSTGCTAKSEVIDAAAYVNHPKSDLLNKVKNGEYNWTLVICDKDSTLKAVAVYDSTVLGQDSTRVRKEVPIDGIPCGEALKELKRLAEVGKQYEKK